uniref:Uncharacterized protein n=1 Tax=Tanacetum cinerariifolium TaxID=118510 RepID=A0A6L2JJJ1_TANCI|nr:hypothetical protein [Tanacetum cinerariifolium]
MAALVLKGNFVISLSIIAEPLSPYHVFGFLDNDTTLNEELFEEDPEEEPKEKEEEMEMEEDIPPIVVAAPLEGSSLTPPPVLESLLDFDTEAPITTDMTIWMQPPGSTFEVGRPSSVFLPPPHLVGCEVMRLRREFEEMYRIMRVLQRSLRTHQSEIGANRTRLGRLVYGATQPSELQGLADSSY